MVIVVEVGGRGGVADYTEALVRALAEAGRRVELVTARDHRYRLPVAVHAWIPWVRESAPLGRVARRARLGRAINALAFVLALPRIARLARRGAVVHMQGEYFPPLTALLALAVRAAGAPFVVTVHNTFDRGREHSLSHRVIRRCARTAIVHTRADAERLGGATVIPHGEYGGLARTGGEVDRATARAALGVGEDELVALLFGQLRPDKGVADFLEAAAAVPGVRPVVAGEDIGGLRAAGPLPARAIVEEGFLPMPAVARLFAAADVAVIPYRVASQSGVLLLAYGFARPAIAYPVGGLVEAVIDGETGWLCAEPTPAALADALREAALAGRAECARRGAAGRRLAEERYSWPAIARATIAVYDRAG